MLKRTAKSCGSDAPRLASSFAEASRPNRALDKTISAGRRWQNSMVTEESTKEAVKTIARGMPGDSGVTVVTMLVCFFYFAREAAGASSARHSLRPLNWGQRIHAPLGRIAPRDRGFTSDVIRAANSTQLSTMHNLLRDHAMDALGAVDGLGHAQIRGQAAKRIGILARQVSFLAEQYDHVAERPHHTLVEVGIHRHRHVVRRRLGTGIVEPQILAQRQAETSLQRGLDRGDADFAVALDAMTVAAGEQRARHEHRQIEFCAGYQL